MTDIVEWLRLVGGERDHHSSNRFHDAADEITRLRAREAALMEALQPFAYEAEGIDTTVHSATRMCLHGLEHLGITEFFDVGGLRRARNAWEGK